MRNQRLYESLGIAFPHPPLSMGGGEYVIDDVVVSFSERGIDTYNSQRRGDTLRKAVLLGINASFEEIDDSNDIHAGFVCGRNESIVVGHSTYVSPETFESAPDLLALVLGDHAVRITLRPEMIEQESEDLFTKQQFERNNSYTYRHLE